MRALSLLSEANVGQWRRGAHAPVRANSVKWANNGERGLRSLGFSRPGKGPPVSEIGRTFWSSP
jgi:hypothetical protein